MINRYITAAILVTTLTCSHLANAVLIRVSNGDTVTNLALETETVWDIDDISGNLLGAFNVDVGGTLYDVAFRDGSLRTVYLNTSIVDVRTSIEAMEFTEALETSVLLNGVRPSRAFDTEPELTSGCSNEIVCRIYTIFGEEYVQDGVPKREASSYMNWHSFGGAASATSTSVIWDFQLNDTRVFAVWSREAVSEVPTPSPISILALGLIGLASRRFKKQS